MRFRIIVALIIFTSFLFTCKQEEGPIDSVSIIPKPNFLQQKEGVFHLQSPIGLQHDPELKISSNFIQNYIKNGTAFQFEPGNDVVISLDQSIVNSEGYRLRINEHGIKISAKNDKGAFYAMQSLRQLLPITFESGKFDRSTIELPFVEIDDEPNFQYRGMHLDVSRHFFSIDFIKKYIDAIAMLKMNTFHWHLTDDQGWRIEIKNYPKLQEIAAFRNETLIGHYSDQPHQFDGIRYGGFYTQEQISEVVDYAQKRHVTIIPEIEMPGHAQAAISAYPELGCTGNQIDVATKWGVFENIYCTKEENFEFLENVLDEVIALFPSKYIHIGGDEAPKKQWKNCSNCQARIEKEGLKDEHELQSYFISRIESYLNDHGREIIGWDEILEGGLAPNATVMSWRGIDGAIKAAQQNHDVIMTPNSHAYFDHYQSKNPDEPIAIGGYLPLKKVYGFNPIPDTLFGEQKKHILGAQGNLWTEYLKTTEQAEYMAFPRMLAMSEVVWTQTGKKEYSNFVERLERFLPRLDTLQINYANHLYELEGNFKTTMEVPEYELQTLLPDKSIRYTLDETEPSVNSSKYDRPIPIEKSCIIKAAVFDENEKLGTTYVKKIQLHKAVGQEISLNVEPHMAYSGTGKFGLINGILGSHKRYGDKEWLGFSGEDLSITIKFEKPISADQIQTRFYNSNGQWIYAPKQVNLSINNGEYKIYQINADTSLVDFKANLDVTEPIESICLKIPNYGMIPEGKPGAGNKAWTFIDEIIIE